MIGVFLGATERLVHAQRHPRIALVDVVSDHYRVHDRVDLRASVIVLLDLGVVRKQPAHLGGAAAEGERIVRGHRSEEHTSELQSQSNLVCRLLLEKKKSYTSKRKVSGQQPRVP